MDDRGRGEAAQGVEARLLSKAERQENGCLVWVRSKTPAGYGLFWLGGKYRLAHRVAYELFVGPIPEDQVIDHKCRNPACIEPTHLEPVTQAENVRRGLLRNRAKTHCPKGHPYELEGLQKIVSGRGPSRRCKPCTYASNEASRKRARARKKERAAA